MKYISNFLILIALGPCVALADLRTWTDSSGNFSVDAELVARDDDNVVLRKQDDELIIVSIAELSEKDNKYLDSPQALKDVDKLEKKQTWTLTTGIELIGNVIGYDSRELVVLRRKGDIYVNDVLFDDLPELERTIVPIIAARFGKTSFENEKEFKEWVREDAKGKATIIVEGVILRLQEDRKLLVPFFVFSDADRAVLEPGWESWLQSNEDEKQAAERELELIARAISRRRNLDAAVNISRLRLQLQAYDAGLFDLWRVYLVYPNGYRISVIVPARTSAEAMQNAVAKYPNLKFGGASKVTRLDR